MPTFDKCLMATLAGLIAVSGCKPHLGSNVWDGAWELDTSKSEAVGRSFNVGIASDGLVTVNNGVHTLRFRCDGKPFQNGVDHSSTCRVENAKQWVVTGGADGKEDIIATWNLSHDDAILTIITNENRASGKRSRLASFVRRTAGTGFAGKWQDTNPLEGRPRLLNTRLEGSHLQLMYPETGQFSDSILDGPTAPIHGPKVRPDSTILVRSADKNRLEIEISVAGHVIRDETLTADGEGHTLTQEAWLPEHPDQKDRLVYRKK